MLPQDTAPAKYNPEPHPLLQLERNALPPETSEEIFQRAKENFSASISGGTQTVYACTARHMLEAERMLGKKFASPPSQKDQLYFLTYLQAGVQKNIKLIRHITVAQNFQFLNGLAHHKP